MPLQGWQRLLADVRWDGGQIPAYSEFMPAPRLGRRACGGSDPLLFAADDPWGWHVTEYEEALELQPGLAQVAAQVLHSLRRLGCGQPAHGIGARQLAGNPCWPEELKRRGAPGHERYVLLLPLALARTQDDKGRLRWTLFGGSERGPARAFWRGFWTAPRREAPAEMALGFLVRLLAAAGEAAADPRSTGLRILAAESDTGAGADPVWQDGPLPGWTAPFLWRAGQPLRGVRYLLAFRPFDRLPRAVRSAYLAGDLHLLPFPGSLVYWGSPAYATLARELPSAAQIPLLHSIERHESPLGMRVPQSGWMHEPRAGAPIEEDSPPLHGPLRNTYQRTHRWARVHRHEDELAVGGREDRVAHVLFSAAADDLGLYGKPMARNAQIWTHDFHLLLDGPQAGREEIVAAAERVAAGGTFGYRFLYPAMRVGRHEVLWHRPLAACLNAEGEPELVPEAPLGVLTAHDVDRPDLSRPIELWPRLLARPPHLAALAQLRAVAGAGGGYRRDLVNARKLLDAWELAGRRPLSPDFARALLTLPKNQTLADWLKSLPDHAADKESLQPLLDALHAVLAEAEPAGAVGARTERNCLSPPGVQPGGRVHEHRPQPDGAGRLASEPLTFHRTARRAFETAYWRTISGLATGRFVNKDNADCVNDRQTQKRLIHPGRDLERLGDFLLHYHERTLARAGAPRGTFASSLPFRWRTDFDFAWSGGWSRNQSGATEERDLVVVIPGRDRARAVIMADHYDTAYMEDVFGYPGRRKGPRLAAAGADDNHSATAALMLGAPVFLELARAGRLACDVWLVHLTGEEFPSDCLGARHLAGCLMRRELRVRTAGGRFRDLSAATVQGLYVLDMVAHNNDKVRDIFQICPGAGPESLWLAGQAHAANRLWNERAPEWNRRHRRGCRRGRRSADGRTQPALALHPQLLGEVRPPADPRSTLYNTDGQIFSDAGIPAVLFMENYDINRHGYHDSHDTMENIDLDYGAAVAAIAIEAVARAASSPRKEPAR